MGIWTKNNQGKKKKDQKNILMRDLSFLSFKKHSPGSGICVLRPLCHNRQRNEQSYWRQLIDFEKQAPYSDLFFSSSFFWFSVMSLYWPCLVIYREVHIFWGRERRIGDGQMNDEIRIPHHHGAVYSSRDPLPAHMHVPDLVIYE